ncbi:hypothetical protein F4814DRAFT_445274 [Daldinia grandis]|nr:hypothetical protein F4814DRAFT_445274 [Daldinia grandis]
MALPGLDIAVLKTSLFKQLEVVVQINLIAIKGIFTTISVFLTPVYQSHANLDVISLNNKSDAWIQEASATLILENVPNPMAGDVALLSPITMDKRDFLQRVTENALHRYGVVNQATWWPLEDI